MDFDQARQRAEEKLAARIEPLRRGQLPQALEPFAKAYLGLFLEIDESIAPPQRVGLLADEPLAGAIREGFHAVARRAELPGAREIGARCARGERLTVGYVVLAGMDSIARGDTNDLHRLPAANLAAALCFCYVNTPSHRFSWATRLLVRRPDICAPALQALWRELMPTISDHLPGLRPVLATEQASALRRTLILPLLERWEGCKQTVLQELLLVALRCSDHDELLNLVRRRVADPDLTDVKKRVYWIACGYLLSPDEFAQPLAEYAGRVREKTLPLLDFSTAVLNQERASGLRVGARDIARLLRIIAPTFRRNEPLTGGLDAVSSNVMQLFDRLARDRSAEAERAVQDLRKVRVMRLYGDVLERVAARQREGT